MPHPTSLLRPKEAAKEEEEEGEKRRERELPLVLSRGHSEVSSPGRRHLGDYRGKWAINNASDRQGAAGRRDSGFGAKRPRTESHLALN